MRPFRESQDALRDAEALRARMAEDGYLFLRGLLPREAVLTARRRMLEILAEAGMVRRDRPLEDGIADMANFAVEPEPAFMKVLYAQYACYELNALQHRPELIGLFERLFGEPALPLPLFICRNIFPQAEAYTTPAHQDYVHIQGTFRNYACWVPMGDCDGELGGLAIAEGTHKLGLLDLRPALGAGALETVGDFEGLWRWSPFRAGDVLIHNCLTVHRGVPNRSKDRMRLSIDYRFQPVSEPMCEQNLKPHRAMATWEELYRGWPDDGLKYYWRKYDLKLTPFDWSYYEKRDRLAFEMAEAGDVRARSALQRIVSNDPSPEKRERARAALARLEARAA